MQVCFNPASWHCLFYAAVAKLYPDWLNGTFTGNMLTKVAVKHHINFFKWHWFHLFIAYAGIAFDFFIIPLLLYKRTRLIALIAAVFFHAFNSAILDIGIFPYFSLAILVFFFSEEDIRKIFFKKKQSHVTKEIIITKKEKTFSFIFFYHVL